MKYKAAGPYRLLVAEKDGQVLGSCSSSPYREHPAFIHTIETSIYLAADFRGQGVGFQLYLKLFAELAAEPIHRAVCGIALPNERSIGLHRKLGFTEVGIFKDYATKHGKHISSIWLQKALRA